MMGEYWWWRGGDFHSDGGILVVAGGDFHSYGGILVVAGGDFHSDGGILVAGGGTSIVMGEYWWWRGGLP